MLSEEGAKRRGGTAPRAPFVLRDDDNGFPAMTADAPRLACQGSLDELRTAATLSESFLDSAKPANVKQFIGMTRYLLKAALALSPPILEDWRSQIPSEQGK